MRLPCGMDASVFLLKQAAKAVGFWWVFAVQKPTPKNRHGNKQ